MILRLLLLALAVSISAKPGQVPFSVPPSFSSLSLKHALHLSPPKSNRPPFHRTYSPQDLLSIQSTDGHTDTTAIRTTRAKVWRPSSPHAYQAARRSSFYTPRALFAGRALTQNEMEDSLWASTLEWREDEVEMPDVTDVATLRQLAMICSNAYSAPSGDWYDLEGKWNVVSAPSPFGLDRVTLNER